MLSNLKLSKVLFLDIETVPIKYNFKELSPVFQKLLGRKNSISEKKGGIHIF